MFRVYKHANQTCFAFSKCESGIFRVGPLRNVYESMRNMNSRRHNFNDHWQLSYLYFSSSFASAFQSPRRSHRAHPFSFSHCHRSRNSTTESPHPHVDLIQLATITFSWLCVSPAMWESSALISSKTMGDSSCFVSPNEARHEWRSAEDIDHQSYVQYWVLIRPGSGLIQLNYSLLSLHWIIWSQIGAFKGREEDERKFEVKDVFFFAS